MSQIILAGQELETHYSGALWWPDKRLLALADLHLEKGSSFARSGQLLPPYDSRETLERLEGLCEAFQPQTLVCLGDSFHDREASERLGEEERARIERLTERLEWIWIAGNHDPTPPKGLGGRTYEEWQLENLIFRHEAEAVPAGYGELSGHFHPKARVRTRARAISARCFVEDGARLILPSFGAYTGGLDVKDPAISSLFKPGFSVTLLGKAKCVRFPSSALV